MYSSWGEFQGVGTQGKRCLENVDPSVKYSLGTACPCDRNPVVAVNGGGTGPDNMLPP